MLQVDIYRFGVKCGKMKVNLEDNIMKNQAKFTEYREKYPEFHYRSFKVREDAQAIYLEYEFEIPGLAKFQPCVKILKKHLDFKPIDSVVVQNLAFQIGMVELVSYWKASCAPKVVVHPGVLDEEQIVWWKKLYFYGLGELFYTNGIAAKLDDFMTIECAPEAREFKYAEVKDDAEGSLVLIGGGKDSNVTMEILGVDPHKDYVMIVNPKPVTRACAAVAGVPDEHVVEVLRKIDPELLKLNEKGFINGHTPFSTMLAFTSYLVSYLLGLKYAVVSNESSANEGNVCGRCEGVEGAQDCGGDLAKGCAGNDLAKVNHQYSKSFEFEQDFRAYAKKHLRAPVQYYSFLRPLNELQIAKLFSKMPQYHQVFKSCNVGSKWPDWQWCDNCAKCMFAFVILSPYLSKDELVEIFHEDLYEKESMWEIFKELTGHGETKPFDCVGTFEEVNYAVSVVAKKLMDAGEKLPVLLKRYVDEYGLADLSKDLTREYNAENNLSTEQEQKLKKALGL